MFTPKERILATAQIAAHLMASGPQMPVAMDPFRAQLFAMGMREVLHGYRQRDGAPSDATYKEAISVAEELLIRVEAEMVVRPIIRLFEALAALEKSQRAAQFRKDVKVAQAIVGLFYAFAEMTPGWGVGVFIGLFGNLAKQVESTRESMVATRKRKKQSIDVSFEEAWARHFKKYGREYIIPHAMRIAYPDFAFYDSYESFRRSYGSSDEALHWRSWCNT